jgi:mono/diheme cytochrome c family protein
MNSRRPIVAGAVATLGLFSAGTAARAQASSAVYDQNCAICHQRAGAGVPGAFPQLAGRAGALAGLPSGRVMMISAVLFGMSGRLQVDGQPIVGLMPSFAQLNDRQVSEALNYVAHLDGARPRPFTPAQVAAIRGASALSPAQVNALARDPVLARAAP